MKLVRKMLGRRQYLEKRLDKRHRSREEIILKELHLRRINACNVEIYSD
jgi:hypothetical protein